MPAVIAGQPPQVQDYNEVTINGIKVFVSKKAVARPSGIKISLSSWGIWKDLVVEGLLQ